MPLDFYTHEIAPEMHRNIFRGKNLGSAVTPANISAIQSGKFYELFIGDYWVIGGVNWRIADMDYFYNTGDTNFNKHHLVIVPDTSLYTAKMNEDNTTEGGYVNSQMRTENLEQAKEKVASAFGSLVLTHKDYLTNAVTNGYPSAGAWVDSTVELMSEIMVYGHTIYTPMNNGTIIPDLHTASKSQFALFAIDPKRANIRATYWLRDVASSTSFCTLNETGYAATGTAKYERAVRPYFCIGL